MKSFKKLAVLTISSLLLTVSLSGCFEDVKNDISRNGGMLTSKGDYVVLSMSDGKIMDCWILHNSFVSFENYADSINFTDNDGNAIILKGTVKVVRVNNSINTRYVEYHAENTTKTYAEVYAESVGTQQPSQGGVSN